MRPNKTQRSTPHRSTFNTRPTSAFRWFHTRSIPQAIRATVYCGAVCLRKLSQGEVAMGFSLQQPSHRTQESSPKLVKSVAQFPSRSDRRLGLHGWKAIAAALDRGVRTVQRWERTLALPVHRLGEGAPCPVFAFQDELQLWLRERAQSKPSTTVKEIETRTSENSSEPEIIKSLSAFFALKGSAHKKVICESCNSSTRILVGQFWLYGTDRAWHVSIPFCPECDSDVRALLPPSSDRVS